MSTERIVFKRGDTIMLGVTATDKAGLPVDLTDVTVEAQVRHEKESNPWFATLDVVWVDRTLGRYELWAPGDSLATGWPVGDLVADIQYSVVQGSRTIRQSTETFKLYINRDVTQ